MEIRHEGLNKYRVVTGRDPHEVREKAAAQQATWDDMWARQLEREQKQADREEKHAAQERRSTEAVRETERLQGIIGKMRTVLQDALTRDPTLDWEALKDRSAFEVKRPPKPSAQPIPPEPDAEDKKYRPDRGLLDRVLSSRYQTRLKQGAELFEKEHGEWERQASAINHENQMEARAHEERLTEWNKEKTAYEATQAKQHEETDALRGEYHGLAKPAIARYCEMVLKRSEYPISFARQVALEYNDQNKILLVEYELPNLDEMPTVSEVKYIKSSDELKEGSLPESRRHDIYDSFVYQLSLRTIHELYAADSVSALDLIVFNGWVASRDRATGQSVHACIVSLQANKSEFSEIDLRQVDPKACFKALKGVSGAKLHGLSPIPPIMAMSREDERFVAAHDVVDGLGEQDNLAAMDWEDFEHLVREVFEAEFVVSGGEVKVTRASRDRGVDAIAFDPDPIRGGKIAIQAKRYTNTVGVEAVRDLYGTVINEGATKGILVTTSDYGPDAYDFAKGKPLILLNGSNLLHLLEKHGHRAKIDLAEARRILAEREGSV
jgi:restriction system protein